MAQWVKDSVLSLLWHRFGLWSVGVTKKIIIAAICNNMDGTRDSHTECSKKEKGKYMISLYLESNIQHK